MGYFFDFFKIRRSTGLCPVEITSPVPQPSISGWVLAGCLLAACFVLAVGSGTLYATVHLLQVVTLLRLQFAEALGMGYFFETSFKHSLRVWVYPDAL